EGRYRGRKVFVRYGIWSKNKPTAEIGHNALSALCRAVGLREIYDSEQLHGVPVLITIKCKSGQGGAVYENIVRCERYTPPRDVASMRAAMRQATPAAQEPRQNAAAQSAAEQAPKEGEDDLPF
ncbi:MAG: DUF669 domain-containing protein, partial [Planctomycetota bacterium]|nr:DUF669 domain-containing protein [Planctomycetota bacterium]